MDVSNSNVTVGKFTSVEVIGNNDTILLTTNGGGSVSINGTGETVSAGGDSVTFAGSAGATAATVTGNNVTINASNDVVSAGGSGDTVNGLKDTITLTAIGASITINGSGNKVNASSETVTFDANDTGTVNGTADIVIVSNG